MAAPPDLATVAPGEGPLDELLAALMQAGEVDSEGAFTLDRKEARKKMQRFQLAEPARYVLELVQAAVLRGARQISVEIDQDDLHLRCDAVPFTLKDFEEIYDALFIPSRSPKRQALRHLALGASTALSMKPAWVRIEGGGVAGSFLQLYPGDKEQLGKTTDADIGLHVHVRQRGRLGVLWRLLGYQDHRQAEFVVIREHCGLSMVPIEINKLPITVGYQLPGTMFWLTFQHGSTRGVVGVLGNSNHLLSRDALPRDYPVALRTTLHLMRNCVSFELDLPPLLLPGFATLVESPSFHLDISHQRVVRNDSYEEAVRLVLGQQIRLLVRECKRLRSRERSLPAHMLEGLVLELLMRLGSLDPLLRWAGRVEAGLLPTPSGYPDAVADAAVLLAAKLWTTPQDQRVSLDDLLTDLQTFGTGAVSTVHAREADRQRPLVLFLATPAIHAIFAKLFPGRLEERNIQSQAAHERARNLEHWRKRKQDPRLPRRPYLAEVPIDLDIMHGELGLADAGPDNVVSLSRPTGGELRLTLIHQGGVLSVQELKVSLPGLHAVVGGDFSPNYAWDDVEPDEKLTIAMLALLVAMPRLVDKLLTLKPRGGIFHAVRELLFLSCSVTAQTALLTQLALPTEGVTEWVPPPPLPLAELTEVKLFEDLTGRPLTIEDLLSAYKQHGYIAAFSRADSSSLHGTNDDGLAALIRHKAGPQAWQKTRRPSLLAGAGGTPIADERPPPFVVFLNGALAILRETLQEVIPPSRIWDAADWLAEVIKEAQAPQEIERPKAQDSSGPAAPAAERATPVTETNPAQSPSAAPASSQTDYYPTDVAAPPPSPLLPASEAKSDPPKPPPRESPAVRARRQQEELLLKELRAELCAVVGPAHKLLGSINLDRIRIGDGDKPLAVICTDYETLINRKHSTVKRALVAAPKDRAVMWFLMSAVYTALNVFFDAVTDDDEAQFLVLLNRHIRRRLRDPRPPVGPVL